MPGRERQGARLDPVLRAVVVVARPSGVGRPKVCDDDTAGSPRSTAIPNRLGWGTYKPQDVVGRKNWTPLQPGFSSTDSARGPPHETPRMSTGSMEGGRFPRGCEACAIPFPHAADRRPAPDRTDAGPPQGPRRSSVRELRSPIGPPPIPKHLPRPAPRGGGKARTASHGEISSPIPPVRTMTLVLDRAMGATLRGVLPRHEGTGRANGSWSGRCPFGPLALARALVDGS